MDRPMEMKTKSFLLFASSVCVWLSGCGLDSTVSNNRNAPCRDEPAPSSGRLFVRYSNPSNFDTVIISLDPRDTRSMSYSWSPARGTQSDVVKGLSFVKYWITARYVRGIDTVDVFESESVDQGASTNDAGCRSYNPESSIDVRVRRWPS